MVRRHFEKAVEQYNEPDEVAANGLPPSQVIAVLGRPAAGRGTLLTRSADRDTCVTLRRRATISALGAVIPVVFLHSVGGNSEAVRSLLEPFYLLAAGVGTLHSPSSVIYFGAQWLLAGIVVFAALSLINATQS